MTSHEYLKIQYSHIWLVGWKCET